VFGKYICYLLKSATGSLYVTTNSPQLISGHYLMLGRKNGQYTFRCASLLQKVFRISPGEALEVCSGWITNRSDLITVDINPARCPTYVGDGQCLPKERENGFYRWYADPPYNARTARCTELRFPRGDKRGNLIMLGYVTEICQNMYATMKDIHN
jgi:hypothetical protein